MVRTELKIQGAAMTVNANHSKTADEGTTAAAAGLSHGICHKIL
jgi:hypothetical protein